MTSDRYDVVIAGYGPVWQARTSGVKKLVRLAEALRDQLGRPYP